jgi:hypothetical protein
VARTRTAGQRGRVKGWGRRPDNRVPFGVGCWCAGRKIAGKTWTVRTSVREPSRSSGVCRAQCRAMLVEGWGVHKCSCLSSATSGKQVIIVQLLRNNVPTAHWGFRGCKQPIKFNSTTASACCTQSSSLRPKRVDASVAPRCCLRGRHMVASVPETEARSSDGPGHRQSSRNNSPEKGPLDVWRPSVQVAQTSQCPRRTNADDPQCQQCDGKAGPSQGPDHGTLAERVADPGEEQRCQLPG